MSHLPSAAGNGQVAVFVQVHLSHDLTSLHKCPPWEVWKSSCETPLFSLATFLWKLLTVACCNTSLILYNCVRLVLRFSRPCLVGCYAVPTANYEPTRRTHPTVLKFVVPNTFCRDIFPQKSRMCLNLVTKAPSFYLYNVGSFEQARVCVWELCVTGMLIWTD